MESSREVKEMRRGAITVGREVTREEKTARQMRAESR